MSLKALTGTRSALIIPLLVILIGCGGGGSSDNGISISGLLTQGAAVSHSISLSLRHSEGENIEEVSICALGECSTTDSAGLWGFVAPESFTGGELLFTIKGHEIDSQKVVTIPEGAKDVEIHFEHGADNHIDLHHLIVDGVTVSEDSGHEE